MLEKLLIHFAVVQVIVVCLATMIYRQIKLPSSRKSLTMVLTGLLYITLNVNLLSDLMRVDNLYIGGIGFAFEMNNLILSGAYLGMLLLTWFMIHCQQRLSQNVRLK